VVLRSKWLHRDKHFSWPVYSISKNYFFGAFALCL